MNTKRFITLLIITCACIGSIYAQENRWRISGSIGPSVPTGKFAGTAIHDSTSAYAEIGLDLKFTADYRITRLFGVSLMVAGQGNTVDTKTLDKNWEAASPGNEVKTHSGTWYMFSTLAGPYIDIPLDQHEKCLVTLRAMAGFLKTAKPAFSTFEQSGGGSLGGTTSTSTSDQSRMGLPWTFAWLTGAGFKYHFTKQFFLLGDLDFTTAGPKYYHPNFLNVGSGGFITTTPITPTPGQPVNKTTQPISALNFSLGAGFSF